MRSGFLETCLALSVEQRGCGFRKLAVGIGRGFAALRLDENAPARSETADGVVDAACERNQLGRDGGIQIGTAKLRGALERAVLVQDDAGADKCGPRQEIRETAAGAADRKGTRPNSRP